MRRLLPSLSLLLLVPILHAEERSVRAPGDDIRQALKLDPFYKKSIVAGGFAIVASKKVSDFAVLEAAYIVDQMLTGRDDIRQAMARNKVRLAVMAATEFTTQIPEHRDLKPAGYWDKRARGLGATRVRPAVSCAEENLLSFPGDPYQGENILVHEFGHAVHEMGLNTIDKTFDQRLRAAYDEAMREGLWKETYAATNRMEYWAEGVQSWFDTNRGKDNQHNGIQTREQLEKYDPRLAKLLAEVFKDNNWRYVRTDQRKEPGHLQGYERSKAPRFVWPPEVLKAWDEAQKEKKKQ